MLTRGRLNVRASTTPTVAPRTAANDPVAKIVESLFKFPPIWNAARNSARNMIAKRADSIGVNMSAMVEELRNNVDWQKEMDEVRNPTLKYPQYYETSFHAYPEGNLSIEAALEVEAAAKSVHSTVFMTSKADPLDPQGDERLRSNYTEKLQLLMTELGVKEPKDIVDFGCATGLSTLELMRAFPAASFTGVDLSEYFLAVGRYQQRKREASTGQKERLRFVHAAAEETGLPSESQDLIGMCLVAHELPQSATRAIIKEAYRLLRPGGAFAIMEMDPQSPAFQRITSNVFAYTAFRSTEPYLDEYLSLDLHAALKEGGFAVSKQYSSTPRHRTVVAVKRA